MALDLFKMLEIQDKFIIEVCKTPFHRVLTEEEIETFSYTKGLYSTKHIHKQIDKMLEYILYTYNKDNFFATNIIPDDKTIKKTLDFVLLTHYMKRYKLEIPLTQRQEQIIKYKLKILSDAKNKTLYNIKLTSILKEILNKYSYHNFVKQRTQDRQRG